jgi:hypothetical protein
MSGRRRHRKTGLTSVLIVTLFLLTRGIDIKLKTFSISRRMVAVMKDSYDVFIEAKIDSIRSVNCNQPLSGIEARLSSL